MTRKRLPIPPIPLAIAAVLVVVVVYGVWSRMVEQQRPDITPTEVDSMSHTNLPETEDQWKERLTPEQYYVLRRKGTERAFTGAYWNTKTDGTYVCAGCGQPLFDAQTKFDSGTGWPSFYAPINEDNVGEHSDNTLFMRRTEVVCSNCNGHLGHVFPDGPAPTGMRYCINSAALSLQEDAISEASE